MNEITKSDIWWDSIFRIILCLKVSLALIIVPSPPPPPLSPPPPTPYFYVGAFDDFFFRSGVRDFRSSHYVSVLKVEIKEAFPKYMSRARSEWSVPFRTNIVEEVNYRRFSKTAKNPKLWQFLRLSDKKNRDDGIKRLSDIIFGANDSKR